MVLILTIKLFQLLELFLKVNIVMENILNEVIENLEQLNLLNIDFELSKKIIIMSIQSVKNYIKCEINSFLDFSLIKDIFIQIVIGEYLLIIKNANLDENMVFEDAIKSISEGDVSITYFDKLETKQDKLNKLIDYYLSKKRLLLNFKSIRW